MRKPDLFIVGAPKCGTTAMAYYLSEHPDIYMSSPKEPHYFNFDFEDRHTKKLDDYERIFFDAGSAKVVSEASVLYLYSECAIENIIRYQPEAKFMVMLRSPADLVYSWHSELIQSWGENIVDFEKAWELSSERREKRLLPRRGVSAKRFDYQSIGMLGSQVQRMMNIVSSENVIFILYDDFKSDPASQYEKTLFFLGLDDDSRQRFQVVNSNRVKKSKMADHAVRAAYKLKNTFGVNTNLGLLSALRRINTKYTERLPLSEQMLLKLHAFYEEEVLLLGKIVGRDLSGWTKP